jgi:hypothetical protein
VNQYLLAAIPLLLLPLGWPNPDPTVGLLTKLWYSPGPSYPAGPPAPTPFGD